MVTSLQYPGYFVTTVNQFITLHFNRNLPVTVSSLQWPSTQCKEVQLYTVNKTNKYTNKLYSLRAGTPFGHTCEWQSHSCIRDPNMSL